jgi:hypothetical protein
MPDPTRSGSHPAPSGHAEVASSMANPLPDLPPKVGIADLAALGLGIGYKARCDCDWIGRRWPTRDEAAAEAWEHARYHREV